MLDAQLFRSALAFALHAAGTGDLRPEYNNVRVTVHAIGAVELRGCDGRRLATVTLDYVPMPVDCVTALDHAGARYLLALLDGVDGALNIAVMQGFGLHLSGALDHFASDAGSAGYPDLSRVTNPSGALNSSAPFALDLATLAGVGPHFEALRPCNQATNPGRFEVRPGQPVLIRGGNDHRILEVLFAMNQERA